MGRGRRHGTLDATPAAAVPAASVPVVPVAGGKRSDAVLARRLVVRPHPNADRLEIAQIDGYVSVVPKGRYRDGDVAVYIPEGMLVPESLLRDLGLWDEEAGKGRLAGSEGTRLKAVRLRGVLSQGLVYAPEGMALTEGEEYGEALGIRKWIPPIPADLDGQLIAEPDLRGYTDIENLRRFPDVLRDGEEVIATEKVHGSCCVVLYRGGEVFVSSKGRAASGLAIVDTKDAHGRSENAYWRSLDAQDLRAKLPRIAEALGADSFLLYGETLGVQDLRYGLAGGEVDFRAFDLRVGDAYLDHDVRSALLEDLGVPQTPLAYRGPFSHAAIEAVTKGTETVSGAGAHIREGVVIRPVMERHDERIGRVILKSISADYLTRGGNTTEFN